MADINAELVDKRSPLFGIRWVKLKGHAVAAEEIADLMAPGRPLVTDETVNREMWPVRERPSGQRRLDVARRRVGNSVKGTLVWYWSIATRSRRKA